MNPRYSRSLIQAFINMFIFGVLMHTALTLWIFSHPLYFPTRYYTYTVKISLTTISKVLSSMIIFLHPMGFNTSSYQGILCAQIVIVFLIYPISEVCIKKWLKARNQRRI